MTLLYKPLVYEIHVEGLLSDTWSDWLEGMTIRSQSDEITMLQGVLPDQAAMLGVLARIHALNLSIILVEKISSDSDDQSS